MSSPPPIHSPKAPDELMVGDLMKQIDEYMDYYNQERCSLKLKKLNPVTY